MSLRARLLTVGCLALAAACAATDSLPVGMQLRQDSSGVSFVENAFPSLTEWKLDSTPVAEISGVGDSARISVVTGLAIMRDGSLLVADGMEKNVRVFDRTGRMLRTAVRQGEGPQELQSVGAVFVSPLDTIYVVDQPGISVVVLDPEARFVRKHVGLDHRPDSMKRRYSRPSIVGVLDDGSLVTSEQPLLTFEEDAPRRPSSYEEIPEEIRRFLSGPRVYRRVSPEKSFGIYPLLRKIPVTNRDSIAIRHNDQQMVFGSRLYLALEDTLGYAVSEGNSSAPRIVTVARPRIKGPVPHDSMRPPGVSVADFNRPLVVPDVLRMMRGRENELWLLSPTSFDLPNFVWFIFDSQDRLIAQMPTTGSFTGLASRDDEVIGVVTNNSHEQSVQVRRYHRR